jgi:hypothetical protein
MSYPTEFRVKPGNLVLKFEFPCGGSLCKQVTPEYEVKFQKVSTCEYYNHKMLSRPNVPRS